MNKLFENINISNNFSSEIALIIILLFFYFFFVLIKKKKFFSIFFILFLTFNLTFSSFQFGKEYFNKKRNYDIDQSKVTLIKNIKRPNIYFFILDGMMPLNEFKDFYKKNLENFENFYDQKNYIYFKDTLNFYPDTQNILTSLFFLDKIFVESDNYDNNNLKPNIYKKFPALLSERYNPVLISELNKLDMNSSGLVKFCCLL